MRYVYSLIRFVPDPARGEFINVGAIVGSEDSSEWEIRQIENPKRARALGNSNALDAVWSFVGQVGTAVDDYAESLDQLFEPEIEPSENWLKDLHRDHRNVVQVTYPTPMVANSASEALEVLFDQLIVDPEQRSFSFRKRNEALAALRHAYAARSIRKNLDLRERVVLTTAHHRNRFDFAVTNGHALQLTHAWSFQIPDQESLSEQIKAWGWTVNEARQHGGVIRVRDELSFDVEQTVDIEVVYVPPAPGASSIALDEARNVFDSLDVRAVPLDEAGVVAARADELLSDAGAGRLGINDHT